jgi:hypothetical protein
MAVKICTAGGRCITCTRTDGLDAEGVSAVIAAEEKAGAKFYCCGTEKGKKKACVRIDRIESVEDVALGEDGEEEGEGRPEAEDQDVSI